MENNTERWKRVPGRDAYEVSDRGGVRTYWVVKTRGKGGGKGTTRVIGEVPKPLRHSIDPTGHPFVQLRDGKGGRANFKVHRLVLEAFVGPAPEGAFGCHHPDPDPMNNRLENLRWDTRSANGIDDYRAGRKSLAGLGIGDVKGICERLAGGQPVKSIAADLGLNPGVVYGIRSGKTWKFVSDLVPGSSVIPVRSERPTEAVYPPADYTEDGAEIWRPIPGYPDYQASTLGQVVSTMPWRGTNWRIRTPVRHPNGRLYVLLYGRDDKLKSFGLHRIVLMTFAGPCPAGMVCCHGDGNPLNCRLDNLRWDTQSANQIDSLRHGTSNRSKLNEDQIRTIRERLNRGETAKAIAPDFGVSDVTVCYIGKRKTWKHVV